MQIKLRDADITDGGRTVVSAKLFTGMLDAMDGDTAAFMLCNGIMQMECGGAVFTFGTMDAGDFPAVNVPLSDEMTKICGITQITGKTEFVAEMNEKSPELEGIFLKLSEDISSAAASNSFTFIKSKSGGIADAELEAFIPRRAYRILAGAVGADSELYAGIKNNCVTFITEDFVFSARTMNNDLKRIEKIVEKVKPKYRAVVDASGLASALDLCQCINAGADDCVDLSITDKAIRLYVKNENGEYDSEVEAQKCIPTDKVYYYKSDNIYKFARGNKGPITVGIDGQGIMKLTCNQTDYIITPRRERKIRIKNDDEKSGKTGKKTKKGKAA
jgi:DNA polymerase III sliding clamp (beta) subunit (PCNA family)